MWLAVLLALSAHPNSISSAMISIDDASGVAHVELRFEGRTAAELLRLDTDGDARLSAAEVAAATPALGAYLLEHYTLTIGGERPESGQRLTPRLASLTLDPDALGPELGSTWLIAELEYSAIPPAAELLWVDCTLFLTSSPDHRNFARFRGPPVVDWVFSAADPLWLIDLPRAALPTQRAPRLPWLRLGFEHILDGPDHLCFVLGILLAAGGLRQLALAITGFTVAHSITLSLAALGTLPAGGRWTEIAIALSIVYVGVANLVAGTPRRVWPEAFAFGLVHGLGFASALRAALGAHGAEVGQLAPLFGFNLGIELGQLCAALVGVGLVSLASKRLAKRETIARLGSVAVAVSGAVWLVLRLFA